MPKLHPLHAQARVGAYNTAIYELQRNIENPVTSHCTREDVVEMKFLARKLKREREAFIQRHCR